MSKIPFSITSMDSLGQGVSKVDNKITFIAKTLPGDKGEAEILAQKKGVQFARATSLSEKSPIRIKPDCVHFEQCPSCHYLHTDYDQELGFKKETLEKLFGRLEHPPIEVIGASSRFGYRNRIQLHFDTKVRKIGMLSAPTNEIVEIPQCLIALPQILEELKKLYENENWLKEVPPKVTQGHVELYWNNGEVQKSWNKPYAEGGFTQVFEEMNQKLKVELVKWFDQTRFAHNLLDLFGGNGNLSQALKYQGRVCIDIYPYPKSQEFISQHLYAPDALKNVKKELQKRGFKPETIILDPPRSGLKDLNDWLNEFGPERVAYVSCDPHTLIRDLKTLAGYQIERILLLDFFPSTFHYETVAFLTKVALK
jgi:23S rRNA (uracil1939-C5)-methyltransferase